MFNDKHRPLFTISIAAELLDCHPRTLRIYEEEGLIHPHRRHNIRYYSEEDIDTIREICELMEEWSLNLSGVKALFSAAERFHIKAERLIEEMLR
ncbi:MAG: MerR family transcriptional regulator [Candidatus Margulisiibacteriota bacterium]